MVNALHAYTHAKHNCHTQYDEVNMLETRTVIVRAAMESVVQYRGSNEHHKIFACVANLEYTQNQTKTA